MSKLKVLGKLNPVQYKQMLDHLTKKKIKNPFIDADDIVVNKKPEVEEREVINAFMRRNPRQDLAGGGMLVQPGFGGTRQGYAKEKPKDPRNTGVGKGSPGIPKDYEPKRDQLYTPEVRAKISETRKKQFLESPLGKRLKWIADNGKNYDSPLKMKKAYEKHFKHTLGTEADALFYTVKGGKNVSVTLGKKGLEVLNKRIPLDRVDNLTNPGKAKSSVFAFTKEFSEDEIFKASIIQNNPKVRNKFIDLFADINENVGTYSVELGPEEMVLKLRSKGGYLLDSYEKGGFDFLFSYPRPGDPMQTIGGVHKGITRNTLLNAGVPEKHIQSFQLVRKPLESIEKILNKVSTNPNYAKKVWGVGAGTSKKIASQLNNFMEGQATAKKIVRDLDNIFIKGQMSKEGYTGTVDSYLKTDAGKTASNNFSKVFGGTQFDHTLAKSIGRDYKYLPRNYLLKGQFTTGKFNRIKKDVFDLPLIELLKGYEKKKVSGAEIKNFIDDFNKKTGGYADFTFDEKTGKIVYPQEKKVIYDLSRYSNPEVVRQELEKNIRLTTSSKFQKNFKEAISKENLKLFKSQEAKNILNNIQSYSKLSKCKVNLKADGGRIGFANSIECIQDGLKEQKIAAQQGNKKAARELVQVGKVATRAGLLKNLLGPGALLGEAVIEGAIIGNKVLGGKPSDIAYAESYLSYLDPRKYRGELDPLKMAREDMLTREVEDAEGNIKTIAAPGSSILKSGFAAQDQLSAFNEAVEDRDIAKARNRIDQYLPAAADAREQGARADQSANIISSDSFKDASRLAQEYLQGQTGANIAKYRTDDFGRFESGGERDLRRRRMQEMKDLYPQYSDQELINMLEGAGYDPQDVINQKTTTRITPAVTSTLTGLDQLRTAFQEQDALQRIADAGGVANLAGGGIAKLAGDSSGRPPESGPNSQGLQGLIKRVKNL